MLKLLFIGMGGFVGSIARYGLAVLLNPTTPGSFPVGTLTANLLGCLVIGGLGALFLGSELHPNYRLFFITGLLGGFTTFSSFGYEALTLFRHNRAGTALLYTLVSVLGGISLAWLGFMLFRRAG